MNFKFPENFIWGAASSAYQIEGCSLEEIILPSSVTFINNCAFKNCTALKTMLKDHISELVGIAGSLICLILFGPDHFIIPSMIVIFVALTLLRPVLDPEYPKTLKKKKKKA